MNILVINGPNLNLLGTRETDVYGTDTLEELMMWLENSPEAAGHSFKFYQSNHEGEIIDSIHDEREWAEGIIINPAAFTHTSVALLDALRSLDKPKIEIHLSNIYNRENYRKNSITASGVNGMICGFGHLSYILAIEALNNLLNNGK